MQSTYSLRAASLSLAFLLSFTLPSLIGAATTALVSSPFIYSFNASGKLEESGSLALSTSPYWWLNSGAYLHLNGTAGATNQGSLPSGDKWRLAYNAASPTDTDNGTHPQNLFRLLSRSTWDNVSVESQFKINRDNFSASPNRNASNGLLLMSRYQNGGDTLYYAGVRVDGDAVIKKKKNGTYTTLAQKEVFAGTYSDGAAVNFVPHGQWLALRTDTLTNSDGSVTVRLYMRKPGASGYTKILEAKDSASPITQSGYVGIRTDFMDVEFDNFKAAKI